MWGVWWRGASTAVLLAVGPLVAPVAAQRGDPASVTDVTVENQSGVATVSIKTLGAPPYQATSLDHPDRLLIDFQGAEYAWRRSPLTVAGDPIKEIRGSQYKKGVARLVLELTRTSDYQIEARADGVVVTLRARENNASVPGAPSIAPAIAPAPEAPRAPATPLLFGIIYVDDAWIAYIEDPATRVVGRYRVGDSVGGRTIDAIEDERVVLRGPEGTVEVRLSDEKPGAPKRPAADRR
jgi:hypothetical protein